MNDLEKLKWEETEETKKYVKGKYIPVERIEELVRIHNIQIYVAFKLGQNSTEKERNRIGASTCTGVTHIQNEQRIPSEIEQQIRADVLKDVIKMVQEMCAEYGLDIPSKVLLEELKAKMIK